MFDLKKNMKHMKFYYPNNSTHSYVIPVTILSESSEKINDVTNADIDETLYYAKSKVQTFLAEQHQEVISTIDNSNFETDDSHDLFDTTISTQSFVQEMKQLKIEAELESGDQIDGIYDKLIQAGEAHPPAQPRILHKTQQVSKKSTNAVLQLTNFYSQIVTDGILNPVKTVGDFFKKAWSSVANALSNIF